MPRTATATVETLAAEVRVLMVGSRQVTLSVARQLDWVRLRDMEPFGRVNLLRDAKDNCVIGRRFDTGELVLAHYQKARSPIDTADDVLHGEICGFQNRDVRRTHQGWRGNEQVWHFKFRERVFTLPLENVVTRECTHKPEAPCTDVIHMVCDEEELAAVIAGSDAAWAHHVAAAALPLIVLAGLK